MSRKEVYIDGREEFLEYLNANKCPTEEKDAKLDCFNRQILTQTICDVADLMANMADELKELRKEISIIRRQMPKR